MINEEKFKKFLKRWIEIPDETANQEMNNELNKCFDIKIEEQINSMECKLNAVKVVLLAMWDDEKYEDYTEAQQLIKEFRKELDEIKRGN